MLWLATGRWTVLVVGVLLFALGTFFASHLLTQVDERITAWLNPWGYEQGIGYQPIQGELAFGRGGLYGTGLGLGLGAQGATPAVPYPTSDFVFAIVGEELGLFGAAAVVVAYLLLVGSGMRTALRARSEFAKLVAAGLTATLGLQAFLIMAGVVRLLPLTGVTLPFVSYGGSSLVANYALLAILMRISNEGNQPDPLGIPAWSSTERIAVSGAATR
jgi:peptidoglycan glycosyltransferase